MGNLHLNNLRGVKKKEKTTKKKLPGIPDLNFASFLFRANFSCVPKDCLLWPLEMVHLAISLKLAQVVLVMRASVSCIKLDDKCFWTTWILVENNKERKEGGSKMWVLSCRSTFNWALFIHRGHVGDLSDRQKVWLDATKINYAMKRTKFWALACCINNDFCALDSTSS